MRKKSDPCKWIWPEWTDQICSEWMILIQIYGSDLSGWIQPELMDPIRINGSDPNPKWLIPSPIWVDGSNLQPELMDAIRMDGSDPNWWIQSELIDLISVNGSDPSCWIQSEWMNVIHDNGFNLTWYCSLTKCQSTKWFLTKSFRTIENVSTKCLLFNGYFCFISDS